MLAAVLAISLCACSPVYVYKAAAGHASLLWHRRSIDKALKDPKTPPELKEKLEIAGAARRFAFDVMGLRRSRQYSTYSMVKRPYLTYVVEACDRLSFTQHLFHFPIIGSFPYKGYFNPKDAQREADSLAALGLDTYVGGVGAYNTGFWLSDPVPSTVLSYSPGDLADLIIHELTHSTAFFKDQVVFNESMATFVGGQGAKEFLSKRYGADSEELKDFLKSQADEERLGRDIDGLYAELDAVYKNSSTESVKLSLRENILKAGLKRLNDEGYHYQVLNNAVIMAHKVYHMDLSVFEDAYKAEGRDWPKTVALFRSLDRRDPMNDLKRRTAELAR